MSPERALTVSEVRIGAAKFRPRPRLREGIVAGFRIGGVSSISSGLS